MNKMTKVKCKECGEWYYVIDEYIDYGYCPDHFDRYYDTNISGTITLKDVPWLGNDLSYRKELQPVTHRGKGTPRIINK